MSFKNYLEEKSDSLSKQLIDMNADRAGKPVVKEDGKEISNSLVIGPYSYILKTSNSKAPYKIIDVNSVTYKASQVELTKDELTLLKKFK